MSTKIYNAFKIRANSLDEVIQLFFNEKEEITKDIEDNILKGILKEMINCYDLFCISGEGVIKEDSEKNKLNLEKDIHSIFLDKLWDRNKKDENKESDDLESSIILYPQSIEHFGEKSYLMQFFAENETIKLVQDTYFKKWNIQEYDYWNNTDQPDTITDYEWELRKNHWKNIDRPLFCGLSITFLKCNKYEVYFNYLTSSKRPQMQKILENLLKEYTVEKRIDKFVFKVKEEVAYKEHYEKFIKDNALENVAHEKLVDALISKGMGVYLDALHQARDNKFNEEQIQEINEKEFLIRSLLKTELSLEDFKIKGEDIKKIKSTPNKLKIK